MVVVVVAAVEVAMVDVVTVERGVAVVRAVVADAEVVNVAEVVMVIVVVIRGMVVAVLDPEWRCTG